MSNAIAEYNPQQAQDGYQSNDPLQQRQQAMIGGQMAGGQMAGGQMAGGNGYGGGAMVAHQGAVGPTGSPLPAGMQEDPHTVQSRVKLSERLKLPIRGGPNEAAPSWEPWLTSQFRLLRKVGLNENWQPGIYFIVNHKLACCHNQVQNNEFQSVLNQVTLDDGFSLDGGIPIPLKNVQVFSTPGTPQFQLFLAKDPSAAINRDNGYSFDMVAPSPEERDRFIEEVNRLKRADASIPSHAPNQTPSGDSDRSCGGDGCVVC